VLLFQQTAANLAAQPGDTISIGRACLDPVTVTVDGIVDIRSELIVPTRRRSDRSTATGTP